MADRTSRWAEAMARRRGRLIELLRKASPTNEILAEAMAALDELDSLHSAITSGMPGRIAGPLKDTSAASQRTMTANRAAGRFAVERTRRGLFLVERFSSQRLPFRCPQQVYEAAVQVMGAAQSPTPFEKLLNELRTAAKEVLPDYLLRMCLRFWMSTKPPLVEKIRARYRPARSTFTRDTRRIWKELAARAE